DHRNIWMVFVALQSICSIGVVYAFLSVAFSELDSLMPFSRRLWTLALAAGLTTAVWQSGVFPYSLESLTMNFFGLQRAIDALVGFALVLLVGFVFWYPVRISRNAAMTSIGATLFLGVRALAAIKVLGADEVETVLFTQRIETVLWIACLAYGCLFLSRSGEVGDSARNVGFRT
ncbi:MAG: hypothetical protein ACJ74Y_04905, partial [Bryobacteraceae bacterium]